LTGIAFHRGSGHRRRRAGARRRAYTTDGRRRYQIGRIITGRLFIIQRRVVSNRRICSCGGSSLSSFAYPLFPFVAAAFAGPAVLLLLLLLLLLAAFGPPVLEPDLNAGFRQADFQRDFFPHENVRVTSFGEQGFQDVQLASGECRPFSSLFPSSSTYRLNYY